MLLTDYLDWAHDPAKDATAPRLHSLLSIPAMMSAVTDHLGKSPAMSIGKIDDDFRDVVVISHESGDLSLLLCPRGDLDVPEFIVCMAELRRRSAELVEACNARVRAALVTHEVASHGRCLAMVAACSSYGAFYLPLPNVVTR